MTCDLCSHGVDNGNCEYCNPGAVPCMMKANTWDLCSFTPGHLGWGTTAGTVYHEGFDDDYCAGRFIPDGVEPSLSSPFTEIDPCRPFVGKLVLQTRDISSFSCPPPERTSCCGAAMGFADGGGSFVTFRYSAGAPIAAGSFVSFEVVGYGSDAGRLFKSVSTDGTNFTSLGTDSDATGVHRFPVSSDASTVYFRLQVGASAAQADGVIIDNVHAELFATSQAPVAVQEGGGTVCIFNAEPFCPTLDLCGTLCGDGMCGSDENACSCPGDCPPSCGDGLCCGGETRTSCCFDCASCGDGVCDSCRGETLSNCCSDCALCGNGTCDTCRGETSINCCSDCAYCGDGTCDTCRGETIGNCCADCACGSCQRCVNGSCVNLCGNVTCDTSCGETCSNCPSDCCFAPPTVPALSEWGVLATGLVGAIAGTLLFNRPYRRRREHGQR